VGGGIGIAPFPYLSERLDAPPAVLGFRSAWHAEAAALVPNADVVIEPTLVTDAMRSASDGAGSDVLACGPEPMLLAVRALAPGAQLAWEAPMACGYGACYGCAVEIGGELKRLCIEGPILCDSSTPAAPNGGAHGSPVDPLLHSSHDRTVAWAAPRRDAAPPASSVARSNTEEREH
jgi:hypothetical protein